MTTQFHNIQNDFSGGEISPKMVLRAEEESVARSVYRMKNFIPTPQGSAVRAPGPRFVEELTAPGNHARIFPYLTPANERSVVVMTSDEIRFMPNVTEVFQPSFDPGDGVTATFRRQIVENNDMSGGVEPWAIYPAAYTSPSTNADLGLKYAAGGINGTASNVSKNDIDTCIIGQIVTVPKLTQRITVAFGIRYMSNFQLEGDYDCVLQVGTTLFGNEVMNLDFKDLTSGQVGAVSQHIGSYPETDAGLAEGSLLFLSVFWRAKAGAESKKSTPRFEVDYFSVWANDEATLSSGVINGTVPYGAKELADVHFVQSPLIPYIGDGSSGDRAGKEMVFTHPSHPPYRLWFNPVAAEYVFEEIPFENPPTIWGADNYPATCASYNSRLVLAGAQGNVKLGSPISGATETVWSTEVGKWDFFSPDSAESVNADDSVIFTTVYRSPIQWIYGQKDLLIGALEMEYVASADGIYQPADLGVFMHSSHGSSNVQPAGFGETVMFPAEGGTKVRSMNYSNDDDGWVAPDLTILHPELCASGIQRMVRMRNPHQMLVVLLKNGELALLHYDKHSGLFGWSRINLSANIRDICVMANEQGVDILYATIVREVDDVKRLYMEAFTDWTDSADLVYLNSYKVFDEGAPTGVLAGLEHLEGRQVQVIGDSVYLGTYTVVGGSVSLVDQLDQPLSVSTAIVGLYMEALIRTLPLATNDPKAPKRYAEITVRIRDSAIPMLGVQSPDERKGIIGLLERPQTRHTLTNLTIPSQRYELRDCTVANLGWGSGQQVNIFENLPQRIEILGVFGKLTKGGI